MGLRRKAGSQTGQADPGDSMRTSFSLPEAPARMETAALRQLNFSATRAISSSLARPSTGGDFSLANQPSPPGCSSSTLSRALGFTRIWIVMWGLGLGLLMMRGSSMS